MCYENNMQWARAHATVPGPDPFDLLASCCQAADEALQTAFVLNAKGMHAAAEQATDAAAQLIQHAKDNLLMLQQQLLSAQHHHQQHVDTTGTLASAGTQQCLGLGVVADEPPAPPGSQAGYPSALAAGRTHLPAALGAFNIPADHARTAAAAAAAAAQMRAWASPACFSASDDTEGEPEVTSHWNAVART